MSASCIVSLAVWNDTGQKVCEIITRKVESLISGTWSVGSLLPTREKRSEFATRLQREAVEFLLVFFGLYWVEGCHPLPSLSLLVFSNLI